MDGLCVDRRRRPPLPLRRTRQEVARKLLRALKAHGDGLPLPGKRKTVGSFFPTWVAVQRHRLRPSTWTRYEQYIRVHVVPHVGSVPLSKLSPQHLDRLYDNRLRAGLSTTTVLHIHRVIHRALETALRYGLVARNVAKLVDRHRRGSSRWRCCRSSRCSSCSTALVVGRSRR